MNPPIGQVVEQQFMAQLTRAKAIIQRLRQTSPNVTRLMRRLRQNIDDNERTRVTDKLRTVFELALYQGGVPPGMVPQLALLLTYTTVEVIDIVTARHGDSIVVYFLCKTVKTLYKLGQMIMSGFMHAVFAVAIESLARTTVDVYVRADEFNLKLLCLSTPQDRGTSIDRLQLLIVNNR